jgi:hypothetical protein
MKLVLPRVFSQRDPLWKDKKLGTSTVSTIGAYGCLLSCAATACCYFKKDTNPAQLNDEMVKHKGFYNGSYWVWGGLTDIYPDIKFDWDVYSEGTCPDKPAPLELIDKLLAEKIPVFVQVDFTPGGSVQEHWVLVKGKEGDYIVQDPWPNPSEEYFFTARYGDPLRYILAIRAYRGPITYEPTDADKISDLETKLQSVNEELAKARLENNSLRDSLTDQERDNKDLATQLSTGRGERDQAVVEKKFAEEQLVDTLSKVANLEKSIVVLEKENRELSDDLAVSQSTILSGLPFWTKFKLLFG